MPKWPSEEWVTGNGLEENLVEVMETLSLDLWVSRNFFTRFSAI